MSMAAAGRVLSLVLVLLSGCAGQGLRPLDPALAVPAAATIADVPFVAQAEGHCGPAALAMALAWSGREVPASALAPRLITKGRGGTLEHDLVGAARAEGRLALPVHGLETVLREVAAGHPPIVLQNLALAWYPQWHYAVVVGYDLVDETIELHSGEDERRRVPLGTFRRTFERAGERAVVVLPPDRLPATGGRGPVLAAAAALERAGRPEAALRAYRQILARWPDDPAAQFGAANALVALGDLAAAAEAFRAAAEFPSTASVALNNLSHVLMLRGDLEGAERAALEAAEGRGAGAAVARRTLEEVRIAKAAS